MKYILKDKLKNFKLFEKLLIYDFIKYKHQHQYAIICAVNFLGNGEDWALGV